jgi:hypothetical protein
LFHILKQDNTLYGPMCEQLICKINDQKWVQKLRG